MKQLLSLAIPFSLFTVLIIQPLPAAGQNHEDELLSMYFAEDELVESATRAPKPLRQVAENVTIITAEEIERMNAHSVAEVLNRVSGVFVSFNGRDFNSSASLHIQESDFEHVLVLIDGLRWNFATGGMAVTDSIPVEIISRIEVIKGPGSSTWGSSLGGVVNIITKKTGSSTRPTGVITGSYGEANSQQYSGTVAGKVGKAGYFLAVGSQDSDGLKGNRFYDRSNIYGKVSLDLPHATTLTLTSGYSEPELRFFDAYEYNWRVEGKDRNFWTTTSLDSSLTDNINLNVSAFRKEQKYILTNYALPDKTFWSETYKDNWTNGISSSVSGHFGSHLLVLGGEFERSESKDETRERQYDETWGVFVNDTISMGDFSLTPGLRYDHPSLTDDMTSPSLGLTWQVTENSLLRVLAAKGFRRPYIDAAAPGLDPEEVYSYQIGFETSALSFCTLKTTLFEHKLKDTWVWDWASSQYSNGSDTKRYGYEVEMATISFHDFSAQASFSYVYTDYYGEME
ncbi:MAG: TonB-dependent receptor, partial [Desulfobulbaceae bacterium]|nr:TonB-dependent receptor [Desulfobulbaceae bacterium]